MSLDLTKTALEIDRMAVGLSAAYAGRRRRLDRALEAVASVDLVDYGRKRLASAETLAWTIPGFDDAPAAHYTAPPPPEDFYVAAVDGSHIDVDRHTATPCFLINIGAAVLRYGSQPDARLSSEPRLYARDDELAIRDSSTTFRAQAIEGAVLGAKRTVDEIRALAQAVRDLPLDIPTLALVDGSLIMLGLIGQGYRDFVLRELIDDGFVQALDELAETASRRPLALASYVSLPRSADVVNALRLELCPYDTADCGQYCSAIAAGDRPCDSGAHGLMDREIFSELLEPGERSAVFTSSSPLVEEHYRGHGVHLFYVQAGEEIGRVEVPTWVAEDEALLGLAHSLVVDQCRRGPGYPIGLIEAHEQAVVTGADRRYFAQLVDEALFAQRLPVYASEKSTTKRLRTL